MVYIRPTAGLLIQLFTQLSAVGKISEQLTHTLHLFQTSLQLHPIISTVSQHGLDCMLCDIYVTVPVNAVVYSTPAANLPKQYKADPCFCHNYDQT